MSPENPRFFYGFEAFSSLGPTFVTHETREGALFLRKQEPDPNRLCAPVAEYVRRDVADQEKKTAIMATVQAAYEAVADRFGWDAADEVLRNVLTSPAAPQGEEP